MRAGNLEGWVVVAVAFWFAVPPSVTGLDIDPLHVAFGQVYPSAVVQQEVLLINSGSNPVQVRAVRSDAPDRLVPLLESKDIEPSGVSVLQLELRAGESAGPFQAVVAIHVEGKGEPFTVHVTAEVVPAYRLIGEPLFFDYRNESSPPFRTVQVQAWAGGMVALDASSVNDPHFDIGVESGSDGSGTTQVIRVQAKEPFPCGLIQKDILIPNLRTDLPPCRLVVAGFNPPVLHVYPYEVVASAVNREQLRMLFIEQPVDDPVRIVRIDVPHRGIRCEVMPESTPYKQRVNVYLRGLDGAKGDIGDLVVVTEREEVGEVRIPVRIGEQQGLQLRFPRNPDLVASKSRCSCQR